MAKLPREAKVPPKKEESPGEAILVTGSSGYIGQHLVKKLADNGHTVVSIYHNRLPEHVENVFPVCSDFESVDLLGAPLRGVSTVVYLTWENSFVGARDNWKFDARFGNSPNNVRILSNLIKAMTLANTRRIIFISANGASIHANSPFLKEKYYAELAIINSAIPEKIIIRPSLISGGDTVHDKLVQSVLEAMKLPYVYPIPCHNHTIAPIQLSDFVDFVFRLVRVELHESCNVVSLVGNKKYRLDEIFKSIAHKHLVKHKLPIKGGLGELIYNLFIKKKSNSGKELLWLDHFMSISNEEDLSLNGYGLRDLIEFKRPCF